MSAESDQTQTDAEAEGGWVHAYAPGTVSNVGPGFDIFGFALAEPGDTVAARPRPRFGAGGQGSAVILSGVKGDDGRLPREAAKNTGGVAAAALMEACQVPDITGVELRLAKGMPLASGLGSSAASAVAAVLATDAALDLGASREALLAAAVEGERAGCGAAHADNAAPSLWGGFVLVRPPATSRGVFRVTSLPVPEGLWCAVVRPHLEVETGVSRALLGERVALADAVAQWGNAAALVAALASGDLELLADAVEDRIAEPLRAAAVPGFAEAKAAAQGAGAFGCSLSGSGPSIFAFAEGRDHAEQLTEALAAALAERGVETDHYTSPVGSPGAHLVAASDPRIA